MSKPDLVTNDSCLDQGEIPKGQLPACDNSASVCEKCGRSPAKSKYPPHTPVLCEFCQQVSDILHSSVEDAVKHQIPHATIPELMAAQREEDRVTVKLAIDRAIRKLKKGSK